MKKILMVCLVFALILTGCTPITEIDVTPYEEEIEALKSKIASLESALLESALPEDDLPEEALPVPNNTSLLNAAVSVMTLLDAGDIDGLAPWIHPTQGVTFSPYSYVEVGVHQVFNATSIIGLLSSQQVFNWGAYDGTGDPIDLTFSDYYQRFVYDQAFLTPHLIAIDQVVSQGSMYVNIDTVFSNASYVEFHFTGFDPQYGGMDWRSLFLVFENINGEWYLIGVVHNEWTI